MHTRDLTPRLGTEVIGFDPESDAVALRGLFTERALLVLRGCPVGPADLARIAAVFGVAEPVTAPFHAIPGVVRLIHDEHTPPGENVWHSDASFRARPPKGSALMAVDVPPAGGDTLWADMRRAYSALDPHVADLLRELRAEHDIAKHAPADRSAELHAAFPARTHPAVIAHPATGDPVLYVNAAYTTRFLSIRRDISDELLDHAVRLSSVPELQCRVTWDTGTVAVWDNLATQHYAVADYFPRRREMLRVVLAGVAPASAASVVTAARR